MAEADIDAARTLTFEQFHALRNRKRNAASGEAGAEDESKSGGGKAGGGDKAAAVVASTERVSFSTTVGDVVEKFEVQLVVIVIIVLDCAAVLTELAIEHGALGARSALLDSAASLLDAFTGFTIFFFLIEVGLVFFAFGERALSHFGYLLDTTVVVAALYWEVNMGTKTLRLLGALRVWRVVRLVKGLVANVEAERDAVGATLAETTVQLEQLETEVRRARDALRREAEAKARVEKQVAGYKDQVETLHEALSIAAMNAAQETLMDGGGDVDAFLEELEREDAGEDGSEGGGDGATQEEQATTRFVVNADGTYASQ